MKAEEVFLKIGNEFLKENLTIEEFEKDPDLIIIPKAMREYARMQIEKDRQRIELKINSKIGGYKEILNPCQYIDGTPIILD